MKTVETVSKELGVHKQTIYKWIYEGKLKSIKIGGAVRITDDQFNTFISDGN